MMMVQLGRESRMLSGSHLSAPLRPPSRRLVMHREGQHTHALVLCVVVCMQGKESTDALSRGR